MYCSLFFAALSSLYISLVQTAIGVLVRSGSGKLLFAVVYFVQCVGVIGK